MSQANPIAAELRSQIWIAMLTADMSQRYWNAIAHRYSNYDKIVRGIKVTSTFLTVASWAFLADIPAVSKFLFLITLFIALGSDVINLSVVIESAKDLSVVYFDLLQEYQELWTDIQSSEMNLDELRVTYRHLYARERDLVRRSTSLPNDKQLDSKCQEEVLISRGLDI